MSGRTLNIDGQKLKDAFKKRGLTAKGVSREYEQSEGYFQTVIARGRISPMAMRNLERDYNIDYDAIKPDEPPIIKAEQMQFTIEEDAIKCVDFDYDKLAKAIVDAIDEKYLGIDYSLLQKSITTSVANALSVTFDNKKPHLGNLIKDNVCAGLKDAKVKSFY